MPIVKLAKREQNGFGVSAPTISLFGPIFLKGELRVWKGNSCLERHHHTSALSPFLLISFYQNTFHQVLFCFLCDLAIVLTLDHDGEKRFSITTSFRFLSKFCGQIGLEVFSEKT